jgi:hypothetical protein
LDNNTGEINSNTPAAEIIEIGHDGLGLIPGEVQLQAGKAYTLHITPTSNGLGCFQELIIPKIDDEAHPIVK